MSQFLPSALRCVLLLLAAAPFAARAQTGGVGIGTTAPDPSAALDVSPADPLKPQGFLPPRLTYQQRTGISNAAAGLLVYQSNSPGGQPGAGYYYYTGTQWLPLLSQGDNLGNHLATQDLAMNGQAVVNAASVGIATSTPVSRLANTSGNILGSDGTGVGGLSLTWATSGQGYAGAFYNADNLASGYNGLAVKVASADAATAALDVSQGPSQTAAGTSLLRVRGDGRVGIGTPAPFSRLANTSGNIVGSDNTGGNPGSLTWAASQPGYAGLLYNAQTGAGANGLAVKVAGTDPAATALDVSTGSSPTGQGAPLLAVRASGATGLGRTPTEGYRLGVGAGPNQSGLYLALSGASTRESLRLEHNGSNLIVRPTSAGGTSTVVENTGGGGLLLNPSGGNVGIGTSSPPRARLDVNGAAFVTNYGQGWNYLGGATPSSYTWTHNLGYKPILMLSIDATGGDYGNYVTYAYEDTDNNNTIIRVYNNFPNTFTHAVFRVRWIIVGQQ